LAYQAKVTEDVRLWYWRRCLTWAITAPYVKGDAGRRPPRTPRWLEVPDGR
jgi:hypothetical protein